MTDKKTAIELIAIERQEQIEKHGHTVERDAKENCVGQLVVGARNLTHEHHCHENDFDGSWSVMICRNMVAKPYKERLIIAAALIVAEYDRVEYVESLKNKKG